FAFARHRNRNGGNAVDSFLNQLPNLGEIRLALAAWTGLRKNGHGPQRGNQEHSKRKRWKPAKTIGLTQKMLCFHNRIAPPEGVGSVNARDYSCHESLRVLKASSVITIPVAKPPETSLTV